MLCQIRIDPYYECWEAHSLRFRKIRNLTASKCSISNQVYNIYKYTRVSPPLCSVQKATGPINIQSLTMKNGRFGNIKKYDRKANNLQN